MERIEPSFIAEAILAAPGWARVGITAPSRWTREDAARELAQSIIEKMQSVNPNTGDRQIGLGL